MSGSDTGDSEVADGAVAVFWDYETCPSPENMTAAHIIEAVSEFANDEEGLECWKVYVPIKTTREFPKARSLLAEIEGVGASLIDCPTKRGETIVSAIHKAILVDMFVFALQYSPPSTVVLITYNPDFAYGVSMLRNRRYTVIWTTVEALVAGTTSEDPLTAVATAEAGTLSLSFSRSEPATTTIDPNKDGTTPLETEPASIDDLAPPNRQSTPEPSATVFPGASSTEVSPRANVAPPMAPPLPPLAPSAQKTGQLPVRSSSQPAATSNSETGPYDALVAALREVPAQLDTHHRWNWLGHRVSQTRSPSSYKIGGKRFKIYVKRAEAAGHIVVEGPEVNGTPYIRLRED